MKKLLLLAFVVLGSALTSCGPTKDDALKYNDEIVNVQKALTPIHESFIDQLDGHNVDSLKIVFHNFNEGVRSSLAACEKMGPFDDKRDYLDAAIAYFKVMKSITENEGKSMTDIVSKDSTQVTTDDETKYNEYATKFDSEYEKALGTVQKAQEVFAKEWKLNLADKP